MAATAGPTKFRASVLLLALLLSVSSAGGSESLLSSSKILSRAKDLRLTLPMDAGEPLLLVRCGAVRRDHARWGIFKVGLLPRISMRDLELQVLGDKESGNWARLFSSFLAGEPPAASLAADGFYLKDASGAVRVSATRAEIGANGQFVLLKSVTISQGSRAGGYDQARLFLSGPEAGLIEIQGSFDRFDPIRDQ